MAEGIEVRHSKACRSRKGGKCDCNPTYRAHLWDGRNERRVRKTCRTRTEAKQWRRDAAAAIAHAEVVITDRSPRLRVALDELLEGMKSGRVLTRSGDPYKPGTVRTYRYAVNDVWVPELGHLRVSEVTRSDVQCVIDDMRVAGASPSTIANTLDPLRVLFRRAARDDIPTRDPTKMLELPAVRSAVRDISAADNADELLTPLWELERVLWATALFAGLRRGELRALRWKDVDLENGKIKVRLSWDDVAGEQSPKTASGARELPLTSALRRELAAWRLRRGGPPADDLVFGEGQTRPFPTSSVDRDAKCAWRDARRERLDELEQELAGATRKADRERVTRELERERSRKWGMTLHAARHAYASTIIDAGLSAVAVKTYMGHSSITTTIDLYGHLFPSTLLADTERLDAHHEARRGTMAGQSGA